MQQAKNLSAALDPERAVATWCRMKELVLASDVQP